jgi:hypothetical protein
VVSSGSMLNVSVGVDREFADAISAVVGVGERLRDLESTADVETSLCSWKLTDDDVLDEFEGPAHAMP